MLDTSATPVTGHFSRRQRQARAYFARLSAEESVVFLPTGNRDEYRVFRTSKKSGVSEVCGNDSLALVRQYYSTRQLGWLADFPKLAQVMGTGQPPSRSQSSGSAKRRN